MKLFGNELTFGETEEEEMNEYKTKKTYIITKKELLEKLGFTNKKITYIAYNYKKGELTIKEE